jgi:hypothetical protein
LGIEKQEHITIVRIDEKHLELSLLGDSKHLCSMLFNAMRTNRILADVVMETVLVYCNYKDDKASLN